MQFDANIYSSHRMNHCDFGDPLTFHVEEAAG